MHRTEGLDEKKTHWGGPKRQLFVKERNAYTRTYVSRTLRHVHQHIGVHIFTAQMQSELFKLVVNLMHKVAHSPHVISVWIKMDYWITRFAQAERELGIRKYG